MNTFRSSLFFKIISLSLVTIFSYHQIIWAAGAVNVVTQKKSKFFNVSQNNTRAFNNVEVPYNLANLVETHIAEENKMVIHIQDAHASLDAQYSIVGLLDTLVSDYDLNFIALEGAEGDIDTSIIRSFPDKEIRKATADFLMKEGQMSAGEFFDITRDEKNVVLCGVEDDDLYKKNLEDFRKIIKTRDPILKMITALNLQMHKIEEKVYSEELMNFISLARRHKGELISFSEYWKELINFVEKTNIDVGEYKNIENLITAIALEKEIDFNKANEERTKLIDDLSYLLGKKDFESLILKSIEFKDKRISPATFYLYLKKIATINGKNFALYQNLMKCTVYMDLYESMNIFGMYREINELEKKIRENLYRSQEERNTYDINVVMDKIKSLYEIELTRADYIFLKTKIGEYDSEKIANFIKEKSGR